LKDRISNYVVSDVYAVYIAYDVLHVIKQPSACWTSLIIFFRSCFPAKKSHVVSVAVFVIIHCLRLVVGLKPCKCIY